MKNSLEEYRKKFEKCQKVFDPTGDHAICALCGCSPELIDHTYSQAVQDCIEALDKVPFYSELVERGNQGEFDVNNLRKITTIDKEEAQQALKNLTK